MGTRLKGGRVWRESKKTQLPPASCWSPERQEPSACQAPDVRPRASSGKVLVALASRRLSRGHLALAIARRGLSISSPPKAKVHSEPRLKAKV